MSASIASPASWAVLIYSSTPADIERDAVASLEDVVHKMPSDGVVVGAQLGRPGGAMRYEVGGGIPRCSPVGQPDMADPASLEAFIQWGLKAFPARHVMLVLGGHGAGFLGAVTDSQRHHVMPPDAVARALAHTDFHPDVLVFNACLMSQTEVAAAVSSSASIMVAAQAEEHGQGLPLGNIVSRLPSTPDPRAAARMAVEEASRTPGQTPCVAALDLSGVGSLLTSLDRLGEGILAHPQERERVREHIQALSGMREGNPWDRPLTDMKDVREFASLLASDRETADLADNARSVVEAATAVVIAAQARPGLGGAYGLSAYLPSQDLQSAIGPAAKPVEAQYARLMSDRAPHWVEALRSLTSY